MSLSYKLLFLKDVDRSVNQSRGVNLQFNGYSIITAAEFDTLPQALLDVEEGFVMPTLEELLSSTGSKLVFKSTLPYTVSNYVPYPKDLTAYSKILSNPGSYLFDTLKTVAAGEYKYVTEDENYRGTSVMELTLSTGMINSSVIPKKFRVDGLVLYGQAYTISYSSEVQQGSLENVVPLALILFVSSSEDSSIYLDPSSTSKTSMQIRMNVAYSTSDVSSVSEDNEYAELWKSFAGSVHVVNDQLATTASYVVEGHGMSEAEVVWEDPYGETLSTDDAVVNFDSKLFFTNDLGDDAYDRNITFASPAKLTVLDKDNPLTDTRLPQFVIGKVLYEKDSSNYLHGTLNGIHHSFFNYNDVSDVFEMDYFAKDKPAISIFSYDTIYDSPWVTESSATFLTSYYPLGRDGGDLTRGTYLFSENSIGCDNSNLIASKNVTAWGDATVLGSNDVLIDTSADNNSENEILVANSSGISINLMRTDAVHTDGTSYDLRATDPNITILGSRDIEILNYTYNDALLNYTKYNGIGSHVGRDFTIINSVGSEYATNDRSLDLNGASGEMLFTYDVTTINSRNHARLARGSVMIGIEHVDTFSAPPSNSHNYIKGAYGCFVMGSNNLIANSTSMYSSDTNSWLTTTVAREASIYMVGKGLRNDARQTKYHSAKYAGAGLAPTIIMGTFNSTYYEEYLCKQLVLGGYNPSFPGTIKYNSLEVGVINGNATDAASATSSTVTGRIKGTRGNVTDWNQETLLTLRDLKGRAINYGSSSLTLYATKGTLIQKNINNYQYTWMGRINWFKLYQLLSRLYWEPGTKTVKYISDAQFEGDILPWNDYTSSSTSTYPSTIFSDLVNDANCEYRYWPQTNVCVETTTKRDRIAGGVS